MYFFYKRCLDVTLASIAIIISAPILLIICLVIKFESTGPILFKQRRIGKEGKQFNIYKFRSMKVDTPNLATDKLNNPETYITKVGKLLRKTSLDELPQLINILKGDMSIVGPRPALYNQYELIATREKYGINKIRPGLTGYAQIMGRDFITDDQKVAYDKYYLDNMSIKFDFKICILTFIKVVKTENIRG
ncbi:sugar transferase [Paenibacillus silviterrae]|uniref:sugar transferase n=1 Tax=Paenibacillus silviterrae TaxID=3242194 RepID=UPI002543DE1D|nr:sugar transferase [Paenibacillus chinjuensis]